MKNSEKTRKLIERMDLFKEDAYKTFANRPKETRVNTYKIVEEVEKIGLSGVVINPNYENNTCAAANGGCGLRDIHRQAGRGVRGGAG